MNIICRKQASISLGCINMNMICRTQVSISLGVHDPGKVGDAVNRVTSGLGKAFAYALNRYVQFLSHSLAQKVLIGISAQARNYDVGNTIKARLNGKR